MKLKDKVCVITGSAQGIGEAIARGYAREGAKVLITDIEAKLEQSKKVAADIGSDLALALDVRDRTSIRNAFQAVANKYGHINVLVNNAGISLPNDFDKQTDEELQKTYFFSGTQLPRLRPIAASERQRDD